MKLYYLPLMLIIICSVFNQIYQNTDFTGYSEDISISGGDWQVNQTINGSDTYLGWDIGAFTIEFDLETSMIAVLASFIIVAVIVGLNILGSGMTDFGGRALYKSLMFMGIWTLFTTLSSEMFFSIPLLGIFLYFFITFVYGLGIVEEIG